MSDRETPAAPRFAASWLFSPGEDLVAFAAPTVVAIALTLALAARGQLGQPIGPYGWLLAVVFVDVAHVYATAYRVYADPAELRRRWRLYLAIPVAAYLLGVGLHRYSEQSFWRALAYLAVFHFVRQQYGWVALCGRRELAFSRADRLLDGLAVYVGTLYPLLYWHLHLPRRFDWFVAGDFAALLGDSSPRLLGLGQALWWTVGLLWLGRQGQRLLSLRSANVSRLLVMVSTWTTWYLGIVYWNSDLAFTITNVLPHGIPYLVLLFRYRRPPRATTPPLRTSLGSTLLGAALSFYLPLVLVAFFEEGLWDRLVWHEHGMLFPGPTIGLSDLALSLLAPLLALPQATHYLLDAWIWKLGPKNPDLRRQLRL